MYILSVSLIFWKCKNNLWIPTHGSKRLSICPIIPMNYSLKEYQSFVVMFLNSLEYKYLPNKQQKQIPKGFVFMQLFTPLPNFESNIKFVQF